MPDVICPTCGVSNRSTSHFCARCGQPLPRVEDDAPGEGPLDPEVTPFTPDALGTPGQPSAPAAGVDLPWLQAVQQHSVQETSDLRRTPPSTPAQLVTPPPPAQPLQPSQPPTVPAPQPPVEQVVAPAQADP